jgi:hypothetical protein
MKIQTAAVGTGAGFLGFNLVRIDGHDTISETVSGPITIADHFEGQDLGDPRFSATVGPRSDDTGRQRTTSDEANMLGLFTNKIIGQQRTIADGIPKNGYMIRDGIR